MKVADAPPPGWYPDPTGGSRLRWWAGTDWSDLYRAPPSPSELDITAHNRHQAPRARAEQPTSTRGPVAEGRGLTRRDADEIISEVRQVARSEVDRAVEVFTQRASAATRQIPPMISEYTNKFFRWVRIAAVVVPLLVIAWFVFQAIVQVSLFEWIGDRIDGLTD